MVKYILIFLIAFGILGSFFYFYPAEIFQATIKGEFAELTTDVSLRTILFNESLPNGLLKENITSVQPTVQGILILLICLIALPVMIAVRFGKDKNSNTQ
ncbi:MAG: hypothetical protein IPM74_11660 [Crocinitomicaceae bacterium]|nr:hypothetical protein [Crocinitomicaceae bacterium]MBK8926536.1 hypothetical protein [Crocinitomicaceae bacterium]